MLKNIIHLAAKRPRTVELKDEKSLCLVYIQRNMILNYTHACMCCNKSYIYIHVYTHVHDEKAQE